jgi:hypothetical protein
MTQAEAPVVVTSPRSYNDKQLDIIARSVYYDTLTFTRALLKEANPDTEKMLAAAAALDAAACGFEPVDDDDETNSDTPSEMRKRSPHNDDLLNELSRDVFVTCIQRVQNYVQGSLTMNTEKLDAYARVADAAASGFKEDSLDDD